MIRVIRGLLEKPTLESIQQQLSTATFADGKLTAYGKAREVKENSQLDMTTHPEIIRLIGQIIGDNREFHLFTKPRKITAPRVSRYGEGQRYGWHNDNVRIDGTRTDISFTLFLEEPENYEGGELEINLGSAVTSVKAAAGDMVIYPTQYVHRVAPVTRGVRLAAIGWVESTIRNELQRDTLIELETVSSQVAAGRVNEDTVNTLQKSIKNLTRLWME